jgi:hypothetical protein
LNPPRPAAEWWFKLVGEWAAWRVESAVFVGFDLAVLQTTQTTARQRALPQQFPFCVPRRRLKFLTGRNGTMHPQSNPPSPSVIVFLPAAATSQELLKFGRAFSTIGHITMPLEQAHRTISALPDAHASMGERGRTRGAQ